MARRNINSRDILGNPAYYAVTLIFSFFLAISATMLLSAPWVLYYNMAASVLLTYLAIEYMVRKRNELPKQFYAIRYQVQILTGMVSVVCIMLSFYEGYTVLLAPLLFYRVYHDYCKDINTTFTRILDYSLLLVGVLSTPMAVIVGNIPIASPLFVVYLAVSSSVVLSLLKDHLEVGLEEYCPMSDVSTRLNSEIMIITQGMVASAMEHHRADINNVPRDHRCSWHLTILNSLEYLDVLMGESVKNPDIGRFVKYLHLKSPCSIIFAGWSDRLLSERASVVMSLVKIFVDLSERSFTESSVNKTIWVTNTQGRVSVKDNSGGALESILLPEEKPFLNTITSDCFLKEYGIKVIINERADHGDGYGLDASIIFS